MSRKQITVYTCDRCRATNLAEPILLQVTVGWDPDPAGGPSMPDTEAIDLCTKCAAISLCELVARGGRQKAGEWVQGIRAMGRL